MNELLPNQVCDTRMESEVYLESVAGQYRRQMLKNKRDSCSLCFNFNTQDFPSLCLAARVSKMPSRTVGNRALILKGTFRQQFTFHSWQAEMDCRTAFEREPARRHALHRSRF
jgi:hypothetical protein